jgi:TP901 family phage tail tape measure protein
MANPKGKITLEFSGKDVGLAQSIGNVTKQLDKLNLAFEKAQPKGKRNPFVAMMANASKASADIGTLRTNVQQLNSALSSMTSAGAKTSFRTMASNASAMNSALLNATATLNTFASALAAVRVHGAALRAPVARAAAGVTAVAAASKAGTASIRGLSLAMTTLGRAMRTGLSAGASTARLAITGLTRAFTMLGNIAKSAVSSLVRLGSAFLTLGKNIGSSVAGLLRFDRHVQSTITNTRGLVGHVNNMNSEIIRFASGIRQIGQAMQNFGMTASVFLSYPISRQLTEATNSALSFQHQMIEARKVTGMTTDEIMSQGKALQDYAAGLDGGFGTPTALEDLADIFIDASRFGVPNQALLDFTIELDKALISTDISAETGAESLARFIAQFYDLTDPEVQNAFPNIAKSALSAINILGQRLPIGEQEILNAAQRFAPTAAQLGFDPADVLGISAVAGSLAASPERAGSQLASMLSAAVKNSEDLAKWMGISGDEFENMFNADPAEAIFKILSGVRSLDGDFSQLKANVEAFGQVGGKAGSSLANAWNQALEAVAIANDEWAKGTANQIEYMRALDSVQNQIGILKNQLNVLGIAFGDALLPVITQILSYLVPAMKLLIDYFRGLSDSTKLWIVGIAALVAVLGPLLFIMGSLAFSIGILITGFASLFTVFFSVVTLPGRMIAGIMGLVGGFGSLIAIVGVATLVLGSLNGAFGAVGQVISTFAQSMYAWGAHIITAFGEGIVEGGIAVYNAVLAVINSIVGLLQAFSPPKEGPLQNIDTWGTNLATTFADAFALGDVSGVQEFAQHIGETLTNAIGGMGIESLELFNNLSSAFEGMVDSFAKASGIGTDDAAIFKTDALAQLVTVIRAIQDGSSDIETAFSSLGDYLGPFADQFKSLLGLQLQYNDELEKQKTIQEELDNLDTKTNNEVKSIAMDETKSVAERVAGIRSVRTRASGRKTQLENDLSASQKRSEEINKEIEALNVLNDTFKKFMPDLSEALKDLGGSIDNLADKLEKIEKSPKDTLLDQLTGNMQENLFPEIGEKAFAHAQEYREELSTVYDDFIAKGHTAEQATIATSDAAEVLLNKLRLMHGLDPLSRFAPDKEKKGAAGGAGGGILDELGGGAGGAGGINGAIAEYQGKLNTIEESTAAFVTNMNGKKEQLTGFFDGLTGKDASVGLDTELQKQYDASYAKGQEVKKKFDEITGGIKKGWDDARLSVEGFKEAFNSFVLGTNVGLDKVVGLPQEEVDKLSTVNRILYQMGAVLGTITAGTMSVSQFIGDIFKGQDESSWAKITGGIKEFGEQFLNTFGMAIFADVPNILKGLVAPLAQLAGLAFDNLGTVGSFLGQVANEAVNLTTGAAAVGLLVSSLLGANNATVSGPLQSLLDSMKDGKFKETIQAALDLGNPSDPVGKQVVDFINKSITDADWTSIGTTLAGVVNGALVGDGTGGLLGVLEGAPISETLGGILDVVTTFTEGLEVGNFVQRIGDILGEILKEISVENVMGLTDPIADGILGIGKSQAYPGIISAAQAIITGIVNSLAGLFANEEFAPTLSGLASTLLQAIVDLPWATAAAGLGDLARAILGAIANAPWADAANTAIDLIVALVGQLAKPETIGAAVEAFSALAAGIVGAIVEQLTSIDWATLIPTLQTWGEELGEAIVNAIRDGVIKGLGGTPFDQLPPEQQKKATDIIDQTHAVTDPLTAPSSAINRVTGEEMVVQPPGSLMVKLWQGIFDKSTEMLESVGAGQAVDSMSDRAVDWLNKQGEILVPPNDTGVSGMGLGAQVHGSWTNPYTGKAYGEAAAPIASAAAPTAAVSLPSDPTALTASVEQYMLGLQTAMATWMTTNSATFFAPLLSGIGMFIGVSIDALNAMMLVYGTQLAAGFSTYMLEGYATFYAPLGTGLVAWMTENTEAFIASGTFIATQIGIGVDKRVSEGGFWDSISTSFVTFVSSIGAGHPILQAADGLADRVVNEISNSIMERWSDVRTAIENLIAKALANSLPPSDSGGDAPPPPGANWRGSGSWRGGATWLNERGPELVDLPAGSRIHNATQTNWMLNNAFDAGYSYAAEGAISSMNNMSASGGGNVINLTIAGDVIVDNKQRVSQLADEVSRKIGRNMRLGR